VLGLLWFLQRRLGRKTARRRDADAITVVGRRGLGGKAQMVIVQTDDARYVLGVSEHGVSLLDRIAAEHRTAAPVFRAEERADAGTRASFDDIIAQASLADPESDAAPAATPQLRRHVHRRPDPLRGSILSPATWRQTAEFIRRPR